MTVTADQFVAKLRTQIGDPYVFGSEVKLSDPNPDKGFDCSELPQWGTAQCHVSPAFPDGAYNQLEHCKRHGLQISVDEAIKTPGAQLYMGDGTGVGRDAIFHTATSQGNGLTIEARGRAYGVGEFSAHRGFTFAAKIPGIDYSKPKPKPARKLERVTIDDLSMPILKRGATGEHVETLQHLLRMKANQRKVAVTSVFDAATELGVNNVKRLLKRADPSVKIDGEAGPRVWKILLEVPIP